MGILSRPRIGALCGLAGPAALIAYFAAPALTGWPYSGASVRAIEQYATGHEDLFYAGAWLQGTGTVLCIVFFAVLLEATGALSRLAAVIAMASAAALLAVVLIEGAFLAAVPAAAAAGDAATVATAFAMSNGAFLRAFPIAPASLTYLALGAALLGASRFHRAFAYSAIALGAAFELAGLAAIFSSAALIPIAVLSGVQALWVAAAAIALWRAA